MRVLLSTIGSRGDVQPVIALAGELRDRGTSVVLCAPPDFRGFIESFGHEFVPMGGPVSSGVARAGLETITPEQVQALVDESVAAQFETVLATGRGCDLLVGTGALQHALHSVAEHLDIPSIWAAYAPMTLPSTKLAPPPNPRLGLPEDAGNATRWEADRESFHRLFGPELNRQRARLGLSPVEDVRSHMFTERPWLAADQVLAPWPAPDELDVVQTGAWLIRDTRPLPADLEAFLDAGEPPIYFGLGSTMRAPQDANLIAVKAARELGRRVIFSQGWSEMSPLAGDPDCLPIGEANFQALFRRVGAVVHHGGSGTTTVALQAGTPQVVLPQRYDQFYFAERTVDLGVGGAHPDSVPTVASLVTALEEALSLAGQARAVAGWTRPDGAAVAADLLLQGG
ncbi:glycosyltransferase [Pseudonocardiaceae bacterium YIM PH 21723]|nr:glycosyltransferase [Pseudonocardiaceae bacterium YIM PH 21723]